MWHKITIVGRLGKDVVLRFSPEGKAIASFPVAVDDGYGDRKMTQWYRVTAFGKDAENCNQFLRKGSMALVEGRMIADKETGGPRIWKKQDGTQGASFEIAASNVRFLDTRGATIEDAPVMASQEEIPF